jgi:RNA polymerase sigma-70 factor, ECF subfamily
MAASVALQLDLQRALPSRPRSAISADREADYQLLVQVRKRQGHALEILYNRYASRALGLAFKILKDRDLAEQVLQDAFWRVWRCADQYEFSRGSFSTWLFTIVHNLAIDQLRRRRNELSLEDSPEAQAIALQGAVGNVPDLASQELRAEEIRSALKTLPEAQRRVLELAYLDGLSRREIAQQLDAPLGTIHTRARLGLEKLRQLFDLDRD